MGPAPLRHPPAGLLWVLALGGVFLGAAQACVLCHLSDRDLSGRLARLCSQVEARWKNCRASWNFPAFALDEMFVSKVIEKTHRVLRVMALCAPACRGSTILYNCSTCESFLAHCWPRKRCLPGSHDLREARILLLSVSITILLLGFLSLAVESRHFKAKSDM
ncbi:sperm-egg fusion protein TMEM95 isoform X3 [Hyaena hyaena]|uniref:sperm-egg fusion protein TMEM95 isoform X3 n=1 Tax=Hyaena hyaena TaxID=95912 RepID=UPI001921E078|nr:sperm-egg fusion protein TMEM95 isoform X3 [Hyaena hyaena]